MTNKQPKAVESMPKSDLKKQLVNFGGKSVGGGSACDLNDEEQVSRSYIIPNVS